MCRGGGLSDAAMDSGIKLMLRTALVISDSFGKEEENQRWWIDSALFVSGPMGSFPVED